MNAPFIPNDAPFSEEQKSWLAGFLAGVQSRSLFDVGTSADADLTRLDILYGTQTGNAEGVAEEAAAAAKAAGFAPHVAELDDISMEQLAQMQNLLIVISTYGEGEMPDNAGLFWGELTSSTAPRLESMHFSVLALGDTGYDEFCQAGKLMDMRLEQLGASAYMIVLIVISTLKNRLNNGPLVYWKSCRVQAVARLSHKAVAKPRQRNPNGTAKTLTLRRSSKTVFSRAKVQLKKSATSHLILAIAN